MEIGQKVKVCRLREKVPADIIEKAQQGLEAEVKSFKMTDGSGIGVFVEFPDSTTSWFFEDEVEVVE
jgi:hypothetical protein